VCPVLLPSGDRAWLATRHEDVRRVLCDPAFSREALTRPEAPKLMPVPPMPSLFFLDPPRHTRIRRLVAPAFGADRIGRLNSRIGRVVDAHLDALAALPQPADLMSALARPLPLAVLSALFGVPDADVEAFTGWIRTAMGFGSPQNVQMEAFSQLGQYLTGLAVVRREDPADDLFSDVVTATDGDDRLADHEVLALVCDLVGAGDQPVTAELAHALLRLLRDPDAVQALHDDPGLVPTAVEELLRHSQSAGGGLGSVRIATAEVELNGACIAAGDAVIPSLNAANLDESVFCNAERLDLARAANPHLTFSDGPHRCLGIEVGRAEMRELIARLTERFPAMGLQVHERDLTWPMAPVFRTPAEIPVSW
jgi:cytochrome P450